MKKLVSFLLAALILCTCFALADESYVGDMIIVNCEEWVSLRAEPNSQSERLDKVPLGDIVEECYLYDDGWAYVQYCGQNGYIIADYLEPYAGSDEDSMLYWEKDGFFIVGEYSCTDQGEVYNIEAFDVNGAPVWSHTAACSYTTELTLVDAFIAGTEDKPLVMAYSAEEGLTALDFYTGEVIWNIPDATVSLGGSISHAVDENGDMYIGGYYGPDPVAISMDGKILWQTDLQGEYYWLYDIEIVGDSLICKYDMNDSTNEPATVEIAKNGNFMGVVY